MSNSDQGEGGIIDGDEDIGPPGVDDDMFADNNDVDHGVDNDADRDAVHDQRYSPDQDDGYDPHDADHDITGSLGAGDMIEGDYNDQDGLGDEKDGGGQSGDDMVVVHGGDKGVRRSVSGEDGRRSISAGSVPGSRAGSKGSRPGGSKSRSRERNSKSKDDSRRSSKSKNDSGKKKSRSRSRKRSGDKSKDRDRRSSRSSRDVRSSRSTRHATSSTDLRHTIRSHARTSTSGRRDVDVRRSRDTRDLKTGGTSVRRGPRDLIPFPGHRPPGGSLDRRRDFDSRRPRGGLGPRRGGPPGRHGEDRGRPWPPRDPHAPPHYRDGGRGGRAPYPTRRPPSPRGAGYRPPSPGRRIGGPPRGRVGSPPLGSGRLPARRAGSPGPGRRAGSADKRPAAYQTGGRHGRSASPRRKEPSPAATAGRRSREGQKPGRDLKDKLFGSSKKDKKGRSSRSSSSSSPEASKPVSKKRKKAAGDSGKPRTHDLTEDLNDSPATGLGMKILKEAINSATKERSKKTVSKSKKKESKTKEKKSKKSAKEGKLKKKIKKEKVDKVEDFIEEISPLHRPPAVVEELEPEPVKMPADLSQDRLGSPLNSDHVVMPDKGLIHPISITNPDFRTGKQGLANAKILGKIQIDIKRNISADQIHFNAKIIRTLGDPRMLVIPRKKYEGKEPIFHFREALMAQKEAAAKAAEPPARGPQIRLVAAPLAKYEEKLKDIIVDEDILNTSREPQLPESRYSGHQQVVPGDARFESEALHQPIHVDNKHKRHPGAVERFDVPYTEVISRSNSKEFRSNSQQEFRSNSQQEFRSNSRNGYRSPSREFRGGVGVDHVARRGSPKVFRNERDEELYSPPPPQLEARKLKADRTKLQELSITENKFRKDTFIEEKRGQSPTLELNDFRLERVREEILAVKSETKYKMEKIREEKGDVKRRGRESPGRRSSSREGAGNRQDLSRPDARQHAKPDFKSEDKDRARDKEREEERFRDKNRDKPSERRDIDLRNDRGQRDNRDTRREVDPRGDRDRKEDKEIRNDRDRSDIRGEIRDNRGDRRDNRGDIRDTNRGKDDIRGKSSHDQNFGHPSHRSRDGEHPGGRFKPGSGPPHRTDHRFEGVRPDHRSRSPHHDDRRRPPPHTDRRGPPPISDRRGPPSIHDRRGPPPIHDRRGPPSGSDRRDHRQGQRGERDSGYGHSAGRGHHDDHRSSQGISEHRRPSGDERRRGGEEERHRGGRGEEPAEEGRGDVKSRLGDKVVGEGGQGDVLARLGDRAHSNGKGQGKGFNVKERLGNLSKEKTKPSYIEHDIRIEDKWDGAKSGAGAGLRSESGAWRHDLYSTEEIDISEEPTSTTN